MGRKSHIGERYGSYTIISDPDKANSSGRRLYCGECVCGRRRMASINGFKRLKSDTCPHFSVYGKAKLANGLFTNLRISGIFRNMLTRCYCESCKDYCYYGARGIDVCQEWISNPKSFEEWALQNGYADDLTIDRIKEDQGYSPDNCRWVTLEENTRFKSNTNYITATVTLSGKQWASLIPEIGTNQINNKIREEGEEATIAYIEERLRDKRVL